MGNFFSNLLYIFLIAFGVIIGASFFVSVGALINNDPPFKTMLDVSKSIKIWAAVLALGGTFSSFEVIEQGLIKGELKSVLKQIIYIAIALIGANGGCMLIKLIRECANLWVD